MKIHRRLLVFILIGFLPLITIFGQESTNENKFRQLRTELPTPNVYRTSSGAPGHKYYQQKANYKMNITLDDQTQRLYGEQTITYYNNSPDILEYLWIQLDQNIRASDSDTYKTRTSRISTTMSIRDLKRLKSTFDGGFKLEKVNGPHVKSYTINKTMMRIDLTTPLKPKSKTEITIKWWYNINNRLEIGGRSGYEYFEKDGNYLYTIAQFFPRMAVYSDFEGWQNKQFLGNGEFALTFGDYDVKITVPSDHVVSATGQLQNASSILTEQQQSLYNKAFSSSEPVIIVSQEEAIEKEKKRETDTKTWHYKAKNVRDFAFVSSRKFIWDAMGVNLGDRTVLAMSLYPKEGNPLWEQYSTRAVAHTLRVYSKYTFDYPYPVAISVHTARIGMEYPMISFNFGRPEEDGTYSERTKYRMISVIIHEIGHNYFPMIVNSDERQWTWMDEGLNSFLQYLSEQEWERDYPSRRGPPQNIVSYMKGNKKYITPIMTNSESIFQFGNNAYGKPATALNILRETILGRELFDYAFKRYSQRWMFKHPTPADFFRTMEDASAVDLDWFWRGWFFTNDHVDISLEAVKWFRPNSLNPDIEKPFSRKQHEKQPISISTQRDDVERQIEQVVVEQDPKAIDFYTTYDPFQIIPLDRKEYQDFIRILSEEEKSFLNDKNTHYYELTFKNIGGLVMPLIVEFTYEDGNKERHHIPTEIWRYNSEEVTKVFLTPKPVSSVTLDPSLETADTDTYNNHWPRKVLPNSFDIFSLPSTENNPMQRNQIGNQE